MELFARAGLEFALNLFAVIPQVSWSTLRRLVYGS